MFSPTTVMIDEEMAGYRVNLARFNEIVAARDVDLFASRNDPQRIEDARQELFRVYRKRQGILYAIAQYEQWRGI